MALALVCCLAAGCAALSKSKNSKAERDPSPADGEKYPAVSEETLQAYAHYATGLSLEMSDDSPAALEEYIKAAEGNPREETLVLEVSRRLLRNKRTDKAIELLTKASSQPGATGVVDAWLGLAYAASGQTNKAITANRTALRKMPAQITPYASLCELYLQQGKTNEIVKLLNDGAAQTNAPVEFYVAFSEVVLRMQARDVLGPEEAKKRAVTVLDKAMLKEPEDPFVQQRIGDAYSFHGEYAKAEKIFEKLFAERPELPGIREKLINTYFKTNKEKAEAMLNELRKDAPTDPRPHMFLGQLALDDNRLPEALEHFETALQLNPNDESLWYRVAALKVSVKKADEALALMEKARGKFRMSFAMEFYTGIALAALEKYQEALSKFVSAEVIAKATEPDRLTAQFYFQLGSASERAKDIEQSVKYFRRALELEPDFAEALNYLGYMWAERGENLDEARTMIERALKEEPKNAAFLDSMAWALFKQNKPAEALPYMKKAIELTKEPDATLLDHLGDILAGMKRTSEAREAWEKALKLDPKDEIRKKLESGS